MRRWVESNVARLMVLLTVAMLLGQVAMGQGADRHGRKYKAPPATASVMVTVVKEANGKPIHNAAVVFHSSKGDKDDGNLEMKTNEQGKASIDVIPLGSKVEIQVIADGYATFGQDYELGTDTSKEIIVKMSRPKAQYSTYTSNNEAPSTSKPGVQEPAHPVPGAATSGPAAPASPAPSSTPAPAAKQPK